MLDQDMTKEMLKRRKNFSKIKIFTIVHLLCDGPASTNVETCTPLLLSMTISVFCITGRGHSVYTFVLAGPSHKR